MPRRGETGAERFEGMQGQFYRPSYYGDEDFTVEGGSGAASISYSNLDDGRPNPDEDHVWYVSEYTGGSDYGGGGTVSKSNYNVLIEEAERLTEDELGGDDSWFQTFYGGHGTYEIAFHVEKTPDEIVGMLEGLSDYPVIDESALSELETEEENEAWENSYREDYRRALEKLFDGDAEDVDDDELFRHFMEWSDKANEYWEHSSEGPYIRVEKIAEKAFDEGEPPSGMQLFWEVQYFVAGPRGNPVEEAIWIKAESGPVAHDRFMELLDAGDERIWGDIEGGRVQRDGEDRVVTFGSQQQRTIGGEWDPASFKMIRVGEVTDVGESGIEEENRLIENSSRQFLSPAMVRGLPVGSIVFPVATDGTFDTALVTLSDGVAPITVLPERSSGWIPEGEPIENWPTQEFVLVKKGTGRVITHKTAQQHAMAFAQSGASMRANGLRRELSNRTTVELDQGRYGFSAWLLSVSGKRGLPISMPSYIRDANEAFDHALAQLRRQQPTLHYVERR
jgi:hypothetical protein